MAQDENLDHARVPWKACSSRQVRERDWATRGSCLSNTHVPSAKIRDGELVQILSHESKACWLVQGNSERIIGDDLGLAVGTDAIDAVRPIAGHEDFGSVSVRGDAVWDRLGKHHDDLAPSGVAVGGDRDPAQTWKRGLDHEQGFARGVEAELVREVSRLLAPKRRGTSWGNSEDTTVVTVPVSGIGDVEIAGVIEDRIIWEAASGRCRCLWTRRQPCRRSDRSSGLPCARCRTHRFAQLGRGRGP